MRNFTERLFVALMLAAGVARGQGGEVPLCQILDRTDTPPWQARVGFVGSSSFKNEGAGSASVMEAGGGGGLAYVRTDYGDFDLTGSVDLRAFSNSAELDLPDRVGSLALRGSYTYRHWSGWSTRLSASPGIYSDLRWATLSAVRAPLEGMVIRSVDPHLSWQAGASWQPGFQHQLDPRGGLRWSRDDGLYIDFMYPESRIVLLPASGWEVVAGIGVDLVSEWWIDDDRESMAMDEARAYLALTHPLTESFHLRYEVGQAFGREIEFREEDGRTLKWDSALFGSIGLGGSF